MKTRGGHPSLPLSLLKSYGSLKWGFLNIQGGGGRRYANEKGRLPGRESMKGEERDSFSQTPSKNRGVRHPLPPPLKSDSLSNEGPFGIIIVKLDLLIFEVRGKRVGREKGGYGGRRRRSPLSNTVIFIPLISSFVGQSSSRCERRVRTPLLFRSLPNCVSMARDQ